MVAQSAQAGPDEFAKADKATKQANAAAVTEQLAVEADAKAQRDAHGAQLVEAANQRAVAASQRVAAARAQIDESARALSPGAQSPAVRAPSALSQASDDLAVSRAPLQTLSRAPESAPVQPAQGSNFPCCAVRKGRIPGVHADWQTCEAQVDRFSGAMFRGFHDEAQALSCADAATQAFTPAPATPPARGAPRGRQKHSARREWWQPPFR